MLNGSENSRLVWTELFQLCVEERLIDRRRSFPIDDE